jgi:hypothetical protein
MNEKGNLKISIYFFIFASKITEIAKNKFRKSNEWYKILFDETKVLKQMF